MSFNHYLNYDIIMCHSLSLSRKPMTVDEFIFELMINLSFACRYYDTNVVDIFNFYNRNMNNSRVYWRTILGHFVSINLQ